MTVIGPAVAVLANRPPEFRHRQHHDVAHALAEILIECGERAAELAEPRRELAFIRSLIHMRIPAAAIGERDLQPDIRFDELRDLQQCLAQASRRIIRAIRGSILGWVGLLEQLHRLESLARR